MELQNIFQKKLERKKFFASLGAGFVGYVLFKKFPFNLIGNKKDKKFTASSEQVNVRINSLAVSRKNIGGNNGRS